MCNEIDFNKRWGIGREEEERKYIEEYLEKIRRLKEMDEIQRTRELVEENEKLKERIKTHLKEKEMNNHIYNQTSTKTPEEIEIERLRKENEQLKEDNKRLSKAFTDVMVMIITGKRPDEDKS